VVFILDISGSMRDGISSHRARVHIATSDYLKGKRLETRLDLAKEELVHTLERLPPATSYNVGFFNDEVFWLHREFQPARPENVRKTALRVRSMTAEQKTNVYEALRQSLEAGWAREHTGAREGPDTVFLLSDGMPSAGKITRFHHLADWAYQVNLGRFVRINTILVGERGHLLLKRLARESTGRFADVGG
jgi:Mg-chelatase subunit ChlD